MKPDIPSKINDPAYRERVYEVVRQIPSGKVMTYGQIAELLGEGYTARTVGYVMHESPEDVPWQRVINSKGGSSTTHITMPFNIQKQMLESEGVIFSDRGFCDLKIYRWVPEWYHKEDDQPSLFE
jgi:methylated-DNA-protein-cysteine methyltransferase-like protein